MVTAPRITKELLEWLDTVYPDRQPSLTDTERVIFWRAGQRELVEHLRNLYTQQQNGEGSADENSASLARDFIRP